MTVSVAVGGGAFFDLFAFLTFLSSVVWNIHYGLAIKYSLVLNVPMTSLLFLSLLISANRALRSIVKD